ncbi:MULTISPECIES: hypothetical protein [unclassified Thioalkalivibrio]|uniref:hypothetical protein n=1 Tax=unclassified Thioalkalivibrio TaxID=2621013 RepID=UPI0003709A1E|nr:MULTISPECIES: hypothetical protein [unclassified Thioalkalivibrio]
MSTRIAAVVALGYPVAVIAGSFLELPRLPLAWLALLILVLAWPALPVLGRGVIALVLAVLVLLLGTEPAGKWLIYAVPVLIQGGLAWLFARSLRPGSTPLITRYALAMGASDSTPVHRYTRRLTAAWALLCGGLALLSAVLAVAVSTTTWALFANGINYLFLAALFMLEYPLRRWLLCDEPRAGFLPYLAALARADHRHILRQR